jgi:hypothetical protein
LKDSQYVLAAIIIDILHLPLAIAVLLFGHLWMSPAIHASTVIVIVFLQVMCLGCPLTVLSGWLRRKGGQNFAFRGGLTFRLYDRFGPIIGIPIFVASVAASYATAKILLG